MWSSHCHFILKTFKIIEKYCSCFYRCVAPSQRTFSLGVQSVIYRCLGKITTSSPSTYYPPWENMETETSQLLLLFILKARRTCFEKLIRLRFCRTKIKQVFVIQHEINSRYPRYAIWPRAGGLSCKPRMLKRMRSADSIPMCRLVFVFFHWKCTQILQKSLSLSIKHACFKRYHHDLLRHLVAFSKFEWFISSDHKIKNFSTHFIHKL